MTLLITLSIIFLLTVTFIKYTLNLNFNDIITIDEIDITEDIAAALL